MSVWLVIVDLRGGRIEAPEIVQIASRLAGSIIDRASQGESDGIGASPTFEAGFLGPGVV